MVCLAEGAMTGGHRAVLTFHGINVGHMAVTNGDLRERLGHRQRHRDRLWTAPVATVARRIVEWRREIGKLSAEERRG